MNYKVIKNNITDLIGLLAFGYTIELILTQESIFNLFETWYSLDSIIHLASLLWLYVHLVAGIAGSQSQSRRYHA